MAIKLNRKGIALSRDERIKEDENLTMIEQEFSRLEQSNTDALDYVSNEAFAQVVDSAKLDWKAPVETVADLSTAYPEATAGYTAMARDTGKVHRFDGSSWGEIQQIDAGPVNELDTRLSQQLADLDAKTLGYGTRLDRPINPEIANLFFLTDKKKRIEFNGSGWQYLDGSPVDVLSVADGNIYPESANYSTQTRTAGQSTLLQTGIDMTKDFIWYANIQLADTDDFAHFQFNIDTSAKIQVSFGYDWVAGVKNGTSISVYDYTDASKTLLGSVNLTTAPRDVVIWYDHKWGFLNVYVDNVLIGSFKPSLSGTPLATLNRAAIVNGSTTTLLTINYVYMAKPLVTAIGDSITAGAIKHAPNASHYAGVDIYNNSYPKQISDYLRLNNIKNYFVVNKGVNSDTTTGMKNRFTADIVNTGCKYCMIHGGINDYTANDPSISVQNKIDMATSALNAGIEPIILGVIPTKSTSVSTSHQYSKDLHSLENLSYGRFAYAEIWQGLVGATADVADDAKMDDTVHPNLSGYIAMAEKIKPLIEFS